MSIEIQCGRCAQRYAAPDRLAGKQVKCPKCAAMVNVPAAGAEPELVPMPSTLGDLLDEELTAGPAVPDPAPRLLPAGPRASLEDEPLSRPAKRRKGGGGKVDVSQRMWAALILLGSVLVVLFIAWFIPAVGALMMVALALAGAGMVLAGAFWALAIAFSEDILCGLMWMFIPFYGLYYIISRWEDTKRPVFLQLSGMAVLILGPCVVGPLLMPGRGWTPNFGTAKSGPTSPVAPIHPPRDPAYSPQPPKAPRLEPKPQKPELKRVLRAETAWKVTAEGVRRLSAGLGKKPLELKGSADEVSGVAFSWPAASRAAVLFRQAKGARRASQPYCWFDVYDLTDGRCLRSITAVEQEELASLSPDGRLLVTFRGGRAILRPLDGRPESHWDLKGARMPGDRTPAALTQAAFLDNNLLAMVLTPGVLAVGQTTDSQPLYIMEDIACMGVSPGGKYLVVMEAGRASAAGHVLEAKSGAVVGNLERPAEPLGWQSCSFSEDAQLLAAGGEDKLVLWDLTSGKITASVPLAVSAGRTDFLTKDLVHSGGALASLTARSVVWNCRFPSNAKTWGRAGAAGQLWLTVGRSSQEPGYLLAISVPDADAQRALARAGEKTPPTEPVSTISAEMLLASVPPRDLPGVKQPKPKFGGPAFGPEFEAVCRSYVRQAHIELIAGEDAALVERLHWFPAGKRPAIGLRWAVGVSLAGTPEQPQPRTVAELAKLTGPIGPQILAALQQRAAEGRFGQWPAADDPRLLPVAFLGGGTQDSLIEAAARQQADAVVMFQLSTKVIGLKRQTDILMKVVLIDVVGERAVWTSEPLSSHAATGTRGKTNPAVELVAAVFKRADEGFALKPMPELQPEVVKRRLEKLAERIDGQSALRGVLAELRYYQAKGLVSANEVLPLYDKALGVGKGRHLATGAAGERRAVLRESIDKL